MRVERARELLAAERRRLERALAQHARQDDGEESDPFFNPANLAAVCRGCHAVKTERERSAASAASNRKRAALRRKRLGRPDEPHPGDD